MAYDKLYLAQGLDLGVNLEVGLLLLLLHLEPVELDPVHPCCLIAVVPKPSKMIQFIYCCFKREAFLLQFHFASHFQSSLLFF